MIETQKNRAVLYCRLSKEDKDKLNEGDDSQSIINQRLLLTEYAIEHNFSVVKVYQDDDYSGLYNDRPAFEELIKDAKLQKFDIVIAKSQSRFTRNMEHMEKYLHNIFPILGIRFIGVVDNTDTFNKSNKKSRQINGLINEWYCEDLSENIKSVFKSKMKDGQYLGSSTPYGYVKDPNDHHKLIIDENAANIVKRIFKLYISGMGKQGIGKLLTLEGVLTPTRYKREVLKINYYNPCLKYDNNIWGFQTIDSILRNEVYIGNTVQAKFEKISYKSKKKKKNPKSQWIRVENTHEPIIDIDTWNTAQELLTLRTKIVNGTQTVDIFTNKIFCSDCGKKLTRKYNKQHEFLGYHCSTYKKLGNFGCASHSVSYNELYNIVFNAIKNEAMSIQNEEADEVLSYCQTDYEHKKYLKEQINILKKQYDKINNYKKFAYENFVDRVISKNEYLQIKYEYDKESDDINHKKYILEEDLNSDSATSEYKQWIEKLKDCINIKALDRNLIIEFIDRIEIETDGTVCIKFKFEKPKINNKVS